MAIQAMDRVPDKVGDYTDFATTTGVAIAKKQLVKYGANADTVTGVTTANDPSIIGTSEEDVPADKAGPTKRIQVRLLSGSGVYVMINGGTVTAGKKIVCGGTDGRVVDVGVAAATDATAVLGFALNSSSIAGEYVPIKPRLPDKEIT